MAASEEAYDYIIVGAGAGGGTLAARLAEAGMRVFLIEAGRDPCLASDPPAGFPSHYEVPAFHAFASENPAIAWNFYVHDFGEDTQRRRPLDKPPPGVLYPRASAIGGCTAHNAMILMYPPDADWDAISALTGDASWSAANMRRYIRRLENCRHRPFWRFLAWITKGRIDPTGHGWTGWLDTEIALPRTAFGDRGLMRTMADIMRAEFRPDDDPPRRWPARIRHELAHIVRRMRRFALTGHDPNDRRAQGALADGMSMVPLSTRSHRRRGARERILDAVAHHRLHVECDALATRVVLDRDKRAVAVEYLKGQNLYRASPRAGDETGVPRTVHAKREVILSGGAFNSPQLLMLSGIGPPEALAAVGIATEVPLPGVGRNLQDRYEIGVVHKAARPWACLADARYAPDDEVAGAWRQGRGMYISNGAAAAGITRSAPHKAEPDLFVMALLTRFYGYFPGYSDVIHQSRDDLTFAVLKGHTKNRGGVISLRSRDPRDPPNIDFRYFEEGSDVGGDDLAAVVKGIRYVRRTALRLREAGLIRAEDLPGAAIECDEQLAEYVREHAWGHHASCTCAIGRGEAGGVLSSDFRVHGTQALRVVDASVFPRIPGFFIASAVYMIAEKAAEVILASARGQPLDSPREGRSA